MYSVMFRTTEIRDGVEECIWISYTGIDYIRCPEFGGYIPPEAVDNFWIEIGVAWRDKPIHLTGHHAVDFLKQFRAYNSRALKVMRYQAGETDSPVEPQ
jgi:hypothetical protein